MSEKSNFNGQRMWAMGLAGLALGGALGAGEANAALGIPVPGSKPKVLAEGGNIAQARMMLAPKLYKDSVIGLKPKLQTDIEDLAVIYEPKASNELIANYGEPELGDSVGFIVESDVGKTVMKLIYFKAKTGKISLVSDKPVPIHGNEEMYAYADPVHSGQSYTAYIAPQTNTHGPVVSFVHSKG